MMNATQKWVSLGQFASGTEAEVVEALLETFGVPFVRRYDQEGSFTRLYLGDGIIPAEIWVPADCLDEALELLANREADLEADMEPGEILAPEEV
jgi:hypothetical protein